MLVVFDLETQKLANEVGGWQHADKMLLSLAVCYVGHRGFLTYREIDVYALIDLLTRADLVVGYNHLNFDYKVLSHYTDVDLPSETVNLDIAQVVSKKLGHRAKLDDVAAATLGIGKSADGLKAVEWFRKEKWDQLEKYCRHDVEVTRDILRFGVNNGFIGMKSKKGNRRIVEIPVDWKWVEEKSARPQVVHPNQQATLFNDRTIGDDLKH